MFYENLVSLCAKNNTSPNAVCNALGLAESAATRWRSGSIPRDTTLKKIADYFGVSVDYLLGKEKEPMASTDSNDTSMDELQALVSQLGQEEQDELRRYVEYLINRKKD